MDREEIIATSNRVADEFGIPRLLLLACGIAESNLNPSARRPKDPGQDADFWPDVSPGVWQQAVRWSKEYLDWCRVDAPSHPPAAFPGADVIEAVMAHYWNVGHAARVAAAQLKAKYDPSEANGIERALARYNWPAGGGKFASDAHAANYRRGIREAEAILGAADTPAAPTAEPRYCFPVEGYPAGPIALHWNVSPNAADLFAARGTPVRAMVDGIVRDASWNAVGGWSVYLVGDPDTKSLHYYMAHLDQQPLVVTGQRVVAGQTLGYVGDTGNASGKGYHLHIGIGSNIKNGSGAEGGAGVPWPGNNANKYLQRVLDVFGSGPTDAAPAPAPVPPADPKDTRIAVLEAEVARLNEALAGERTKLGVLQAQYLPTLADVVKAIGELKPAT